MNTAFYNKGFIWSIVVVMGLLFVFVGSLTLMVYAGPYVRPMRTIKYQDADVCKMEIYDHGGGRGKIRYYKKEQGYWFENRKERGY